MAMTITPHDETEFETTSRRRKITKFALAGVAVLGVGAALTSAAWSDNVFFRGDASTANLDLEGSVDNGGSWQSGDDALLPITIPALENVGPGQTDTHTVLVRNSGTVDVYLNEISIAGTGLLFQGGFPASPTIGSVSDPDRILAPNETTSIEVRVTGNSAWTNGQYTNTAGVVTVTVRGTSDIPTP
jgi:hypothetical protein